MVIASVHECLLLSSLQGPAVKLIALLSSQPSLKNQQEFGTLLLASLQTSATLGPFTVSFGEAAVENPKAIFKSVLQAPKGTYLHH